MTNLGNYLHGQYVPECGCFSEEELETAYIIVNTTCGKSLPVPLSDLGLDASVYMCEGKKSKLAPIKDKTTEVEKEIPKTVKVEIK